MVGRHSLEAWGCLAALCDVSGVELRSQALSGALISAAYIKHKTIQKARGLPWSLVTGNVLENLASLKEGHPPAEPTSHKIWRLLQVGYSMRQLLEGVELLGGPVMEHHWS